MEEPMQEQEPAVTQKTLKGYEIPVPTREQVMGFFKKVAKPKPQKN
jgi:hypothetical protein